MVSQLKTLLYIGVSFLASIVVKKEKPLLYGIAILELLRASRATRVSSIIIASTCEGQLESKEHELNYLHVLYPLPGIGIPMLIILNL